MFGLLLMFLFWKEKEEAGVRVISEQVFFLFWRIKKLSVVSALTYDVELYHQEVI